MYADLSTNSIGESGEWHLVIHLVISIVSLIQFPFSPLLLTIHTIMSYKTRVMLVVIVTKITNVPTKNKSQLQIHFL